LFPKLSEAPLGTSNPLGQSAACLGKVTGEFLRSKTRKRQLNQVFTTEITEITEELAHETLLGLYSVLPVLCGELHGRGNHWT